MFPVALTKQLMNNNNREVVKKKKIDSLSMKRV